MCSEVSGRRFPNVWPQVSLAPLSPALPSEIDGSCAAGSIAVFGVVDGRPDLSVIVYTPATQADAERVRALVRRRSADAAAA